MRRLLLSIISLLFPLSLLQGCFVHPPSGMMINPVLAVAGAAVGKQDEWRATAAEKAWPKEQLKLIKSGDLKASANCLFAVYFLEMKKQTESRGNAGQLIMSQKELCVKNVLEAWGAQPENYEQAAAAMVAYWVQAQEAESRGDVAEGKRLRFKALSYVKRDAFTYKSDDERYSIKYKDQYDSSRKLSTGDLVFDLLVSLRVLDRGSRVCIYPQEVGSYIIEPKFKQAEILGLACNYKLLKLETRKWKVLFDNERYTQRKMPEGLSACDELKENKYKVIGKGVILLSSSPDGKGMIYKREPYELYQDGCLVQENVSNEKGEVIFDYAEESRYYLETFQRLHRVEPDRIIK